MISIITAAYDCECFIRDTFESLKRQTYDDWEWVVVEDCSSDGTLYEIETIASSDNRVRLLQNLSNKGAAQSRNRAIDNARGEFLAFIDSDDMWCPEKLERQIAFMSDNINFSFTGYEIINESGIATGKEVDVSGTAKMTYTDMLAKRATLGCSTVMLRSTTIGSLRMPAFKSGEDYAFWLRILRAGVQAHLLPEPLTYYRIRKNSLSRNKFLKARQQWRIYRELENIGFVAAMKYFMFYVVRALNR